MLVLLFGVNPATAVSGDVVASAFMKPVGALVHIRARTVHWGLVGWLSAGSVPGVILGTVVFARVLTTDEAAETIKTWIGWVLLVAVGAMIAKTWVSRRASGLRSQTDLLGTDMPVKALPTLALGLVVGILVGMTSVGSGSLVVTTLLLLYPLLRPSVLVGTDLTQAVPMLIAGAIAHAGFGDISIAVVVSLLIGQIPGVWGRRPHVVAVRRSRPAVAAHGHPRRHGDEVAGAAQPDCWHDRCRRRRRRHRPHHQGTHPWQDERHEWQRRLTRQRRRR